MARIWPRVSIAASTTGFTIGTDDIGGAKTLQVNPMVQLPDADIRSVSVRRGGRRWNYDTGEAVVVFDNRGDDYDPSVLSGPYGDRLRPGLVVQIAARVDDSSTNVIYTGKLVDVRTNPNPHAPTVTWILEDALSDLGQMEVTAPGGAVDNLESIAYDMMDEAHLDTSGIPEIDGRIVQRPAPGITYREAFDLFAAAEAGRFFVDRYNTPKLRIRATEAGLSELLTLNAGPVSPWYREATMAPGFSQVTNTVTVQREGDGLPDVSASNSPSVSLFGRRDRVVKTALTQYKDALELARFLADYYSQPAPLVESVTCLPLAWAGSSVATLCSADIGSLVKVSLPNGGSSRGTVERIEWDFDAGGVSVRLGLDRYDPAGYGNASWFVLDSSSLGSADLLAAF